MRAIVLKDFGGVDQLSFENLPQPQLKPGEMLIRNKAFSINPVDIKTRKGKGQAARLRKDPPMILGWDVSGVVEDAGDSTEFKPGDEVFGMINIPGHGKAYAEYVAVNTAHIARKPENISHAHAAAASLAAMTAWQALVTQAKVQRGQRVLIEAASGGVGHYAVQIAKFLGAYVIGTSSAANREFVMSLGADEHIDYHQGDLHNMTEEVDMVLDALGGENIPRSLRVLKKGGTIVSLPSGISETVGEQAAAQGKNGIFFFVQSDSADMEKIAGLLTQNLLRSHLDAIYSFDQIAEAHNHVESGRTVGKVVVTLEK